jgi:hypothetical protein
MTSFILSSMFLLTDPTCEVEERTIAALEVQVDEQEDAILLLEDYLFDLYISLNPAGAGSCSEKPAGPDRDICQCIADGKGVGTGLTDCITEKAGGPIGGL